MFSLHITTQYVSLDITELWSGPNDFKYNNFNF